MQDGKHGKAYGILTWRGQQQNEAPRRINGAAKKVWRVLGIDRSVKVGEEWPSLVVSSLVEKSEKTEENGTSDLKGSSTSVSETAEPEVK